MRCVSCLNYSLSLVCRNCQKLFLKPEIGKVVLESGLVVYYFYKYSEIKNLLLSKYEIFGSEIFNILAKNSFTPFSKNLKFENNVYSIGVDDNVIKGFSHSAILAKSIESKYIKPKFNSLIATNRVKYAGENKSFRLANPRKFKYMGKENIDVILVDDILTYGFTLNEAYKKLSKLKVNVLFALVLAKV